MKNGQMIIGLGAMGVAFAILSYGAISTPKPAPEPYVSENCARYADWKENSVKLYQDKNNPNRYRVAHPPKSVRLRWEKIAYDNGCKP